MNVHTERGQWQASFTIGYLAEVSVTEPISQNPGFLSMFCASEAHFCSPHTNFGTKTKFFVTKLYYLDDILKSHYQVNSEESAIHYMIYTVGGFTFDENGSYSSVSSSLCSSSPWVAAIPLLQVSFTPCCIRVGLILLSCGTTNLQSSWTSCRPLLILTCTLSLFLFFFRTSQMNLKTTVSRGSCS